MEFERTFVMLKPDAISRGLIGEIISRIENRNYRIIEARLMKLDPKLLYRYYAHISDQPFFLDVYDYMLSGPVLGLCVRGENVVKGMQTLVGATKTEDALPGTIRGDYASSISNNLVHTSDSIESAKKEIASFFESITIDKRPF